MSRSAFAPSRSWHPLKIMVIGVLIHVLVAISAPLYLTINDGALALALGVYMAGFASVVFGGVLYHLAPREFGTRKNQGSSLGPTLLGVHQMIVWLTLLGVVLRAVDRFFYRGLSLTGTSFIDRRASLANDGASLLGVVGAVLFAMALPAMLNLISLRRLGLRPKRHVSIITVLTFAFLNLDSAVLGSRGVLVVSAASVTLHLLAGRPVLQIMKRIPIVIVGALVLFAASTSMFERRLETMGFTPEESIVRSNYAYTVQPTSDVLSFSLRLSQGGRRMLASVINFAQYYTHGFYELGLLAQNAPLDNLLLGGATLPPLARLFNGDVTAESASSPVRSGVFTTLFGPLFLDFRWLMVPVLTVFGMLVTHVWHKSRSPTSITSQAFLSYLNVVLLFAPVVSLFQNALGAYFLAGFSVSAMLSFGAMRVSFRAKSIL